MKYQLVFQFAADSEQAFDDLQALTETVENFLEGDTQSFVDGHDYGLGKYNMFLDSEDPEATFSKVKVYVESQSPGLSYESAYREFGEDDFIILWPPELKEFELL